MGRGEARVGALCHTRKAGLHVSCVFAFAAPLTLPGVAIVGIGRAVVAVVTQRPALLLRLALSNTDHAKLLQQN
eukprot:scaffold13034_cov21-Prasinocladus_malaysianus.AAC.1